MTPSASLPLPLPLVARSTQLAVLHTALDQAAGGHGSTVLITGEGGGGKSRLVRAVADDAARRGWTVAVGRAYPVETGVPYALFSDALLPLLRSLEPAKLSVLARGGEAELGYLFPALAPAGERDRPHRGDPAEFKARLLWNLTELLGRFSAQQPLLIALEALEWADASSLELLHFVARQIGGHRILLLCTYNEAERERNPALRSAEQSLVSLGLARVLELGPLTRAETGELVQRAFGVEESVCREFSALLHEWTRGNVFFIEETLKALVDAGRLRNEQGVWLGWELENLTLPRSIRDALMARFDRLSAPARALAELAAVTAGRDTYDALRSLTGLPEPELLAALEELRLQHILREAAEGGTIVYDFAHPLLRETLYGALGMARTRALHASVAEALEALYGDEVMDHADQLAFHYARADARNLAPKALKYLVAAGRRALARHANREAANYLSAALEHVERGTELDAELAGTLAADLARARQRLGEYAAAIALWERARSQAERMGDPRRLAAIERRLGLAYYWSGHHPEALRHYDAGLAAARAAADDEVRVKLQLARGNCLQELGRPEEAKQEIQAALSLAERLGDRSLLARAHRALLMLHIWTGPPERAREHGARAVALAHECGRRAVECSVHWGLAVLEGLTGDAQASARHLRESERIAEELRSPLLRLWTAEIAIEYESATGDWDSALAVAERSVALARALGQRTLLPRLLVWAALVYLGRGELEKGKRYVDEAWELSGAEGEGPLAVNVVVPAYMGRAAFHLANGEYLEAIRVGEAGLAIADRSGYTVWAVHRLMPVIAEAYLWLNDLEGAQRLGQRLRRDSERLGHKLGLAWADACDACVAWLGGDSRRAVGLLQNAAAELEAIPWIPDAARLRRQLGGRLAETGDREGAIRELRHVHEIFARLGAEQELDKARLQLRDLGARPPTRAVSVGAGGLTGRELEIIRLVAERKSNKAIGKTLAISPRTVSTHLSNIFRKLNVGSRAELTDFARAGRLPE